MLLKYVLKLELFNVVNVVVKIATNGLQLLEGRDLENEIINLKIKLC
jgi:hypothetical protein